MQSGNSLKALLLALVIVIGFMVCWEYYWRSRGFTPTYNDDKVLWASKRKEVYASPDQATVFIGGSRIKFDLDIPTWEKLTGEKAIQLAIVGTPARLTLRDLANDEKFKGKLIIDANEIQLFSLDTVRRDKSAREAIEYYYNETPAQKTSASINYALESNLIFLEEGKFGLTALLNDLKIPNRPGVIGLPVFPKEFSATNFNRQTYMTPMFLANPSLQKRQTDAWTRMGVSEMNKTPGIKGDTLEAKLKELKTSIDRIRSRGGLIIFVRLPSNNQYLAAENKAYPRRQYWDRLLEYTNTPGIHFSDYPEIANFTCPEWSHLSPRDGVIFTENLVKILQEEKGWTFPNKTKPTAYNINR